MRFRILHHIGPSIAACCVGGNLPSHPVVVSFNNGASTSHPCLALRTLRVQSVSSSPFRYLVTSSLPYFASD
jgi:hypothetical protein